MEEAEKEKLQKEPATQQQLREQEAKKLKEEAERKRLEGTAASRSFTKTS